MSSGFIDSEAEESGEELAVSNQDEEEEEDEIEDEKMIGFVTDNDETSHDESESDNVAGAKKRQRDEDEIDDDLDEDDFDLIKENAGIDLQRSKRFRRVRRHLESDDDEESEDDIMALPPEAEPVITRQPTRREIQQPALAGDMYGDISSEEIDTFIVDEEGRPIHEDYEDEVDEAMQDANDIFRMDFRYLDDEIEEYEDYDFEEGEEELQDEGAPRSRRRAKKASVRKVRSLFEVYEPSELESRYLTKRDEKIKIADIPERFQIRKIPVSKADDESELDDEAQWIFSHAFNNPTITNQNVYYGPGPQLISTIREILGLIRNECLEIPFIAHYRKETYQQHGLQVDDLWRIYNWDEKWMGFIRRKRNMMKLFGKVQQYQYETAKNTHDFSTFNIKIIDAEDMARLNECRAFEELQDIYDHFLLYHHKELDGLRNENLKGPDKDGNNDENRKQACGGIRRLRRRNQYTKCEDDKIGHLALKFGLSPERFGKNVLESYQVNEPTQYDVDPNTTARDYITKSFPTTEAVLNAAIYMVAIQLSRDPLVRRAIRSAFYERAKLICRPTKSGKKNIDGTHSYASIKYVTNKPIRELKDDEFLQMCKAEKEGFITIKFVIEPTTRMWPTYADELKQYYYVDGYSDLIKEWNELRGRAVQKAIEEMLYGDFQKELKEKLLKEAHDFVLRACCQNLRNRLNVAPFKIDSENDEDEYNEPFSRIMGFAFVSDRDVAAYTVVVDGHGEVNDFIKLNHLLRGPRNLDVDENSDRVKEIKLIKGLIVTKQPIAIAISASCRQAIGVKKDLEEIVNDLVTEEDMPPIRIELVDPSIARIFETSKRSKTEFPEYPPLLTHAISLARYMQDPLVEIVQLLTLDEEEMLCMRFHSLQAELSKYDLLEALLLEFVKCVNDVGVDLNLCLTNDRYSATLPFVCGLGPRKAGAIVTLLKRGNQRLGNRKSLVTECGMGPNMFVNCAGFVKIPIEKVEDSDYAEILDSTRIHPEAYDWARKMAIDALDYDESADDVNQATVVHDIIDQPDKLKDLDLDAFAEELKRQRFGNKSITLYDIREELTFRYKECRNPFVSLSQENVFYLLIDETPESLYYGQLITCRVISIVYRQPTKDQIDRVNPERDPKSGVWSCPLCLSCCFNELSEVWVHIDGNQCRGIAIGVKAVLDNGLIGFISTKNISDKHVRTPEDRVRVGMVVHCRIIKLNIEKFSVDLSCKSSDLTDRDGQYSVSKDRYYDEEAERADIEEETKKTKQKRIPYIKRVIVHPSFHNISYKEAVEKLSNVDSGEALFRPSRKGSDHLTLTWKVADDIYQHVDIREEGKANSFSLGHSLWIDNEEYEDLDEILARYVQPVAASVREVINHRYYYAADGGEKKKLENYLLSEKKKQPTRIPYHFSASKTYPGKFILCCLPRTHACFEYMTVTPNGFRYRGRIYSNLDALVHYYKRHLFK